jgi:formylglycine-generating enzyme required for sulfatase activity
MIKFSKNWSKSLGWLKPVCLVILFFGLTMINSIVFANVPNTGDLTVIITNDLGMTFKHIPAGTFIMGSPVDEPGRWNGETQHQVTLTKDYYMMSTEVTQKQWVDVMGSNPSSYSSCGDDCPVENVSWNEVQTFITELNKRGEGTYRLPTEAEWEYAARAGTTTAFNTGACLSTDQGNYYGYYPQAGCPSGEYRESPVTVASFAANTWGLYDMHGNVFEWCQDLYQFDLGSSAVTDPTGSSSGSKRVNRGGGWNYDAMYSRSSYRYSFNPDRRLSDLGFRLAFSPGQ